MAVGHQILEIAFYVMRDSVTYEELGRLLHVSTRSAPCVVTSGNWKRSGFT
jgi:hypothetical protein